MFRLLNYCHLASLIRRYLISLTDAHNAKGQITDRTYQESVLFEAGCSMCGGCYHVSNLEPTLYISRVSTHLPYLPEFALFAAFSSLISVWRRFMVLLTRTERRRKTSGSSMSFSLRTDTFSTRLRSSFARYLQKGMRSVDCLCQIMIIQTTSPMHADTFKNSLNHHLKLIHGRKQSPRPYCFSLNDVIVSVVVCTIRVGSNRRTQRQSLI